MNKSVVLIEDDRDTNDTITSILGDHGFDVETYFKYEDFANQNDSMNAHSYLIDLNLPGLNGFEVIKNIRSKNKLAAIFLMTASTETGLSLEALGIGADHFLKKPFDLDELILRFENAHKKLTSVENDRLDNGLRLLSQAQVLIKDGTYIKLTPREFKIVEALHETGKPVTRQDLLSQFQTETDLRERNIDVHINALRKKLAPYEISIETIWGTGYKLHWAS